METETDYKYKDKDWLSRMLQEKTIKEIAEQCQVHEMTIQYWKKKHSIEKPSLRGKKISGKWFKIHCGYAQYNPNHPLAGKWGCILQSRLVASQILGRWIASNEEVFHKDGNCYNNEPSNLIILPRYGHLK